MRDENRTARAEAIEVAAYAVLEAKGYAGASMIAIARSAKASNETLYNWYGDKQGLFRALVARNAAEVRALVEAEVALEDPMGTLARLGPVLLGLVLGNRAVALNRAAAADASGDLGAAIAQAGREAVVPLIAQVLEAARAQGALAFGDTQEAAALFVDLLVGDMQVRRVIGQMAQPDAAFCAARAALAMQRFRRLCG